MNLIDYYGLLAVALVIGSLGALFFRNLKIRAGTAFILTIILLCPLGAGQASSAMRIFAAIDTPSISLIILAISNILGRNNMFRPGIALTALMIGAALYLTELGIVPYDLYSWGYNDKIVAVTCCIGVILVNIKEICFLLIGLILLRTGCYANFFDVFLDPVFVAWSLIFTLYQISRYLRFRKKKFNERKKSDQSEGQLGS